MIFAWKNLILSNQHTGVQRQPSILQMTHRYICAVGYLSVSHKWQSLQDDGERQALR